MEDNHFYAGRNDKVVNYIEPGSKRWSVQLVTENFLPGDVKAILAIPIPHHTVKDKLVLADSNSGIYTAKEGYKFWKKQSAVVLQVTQSQGWKKIWHMLIPHKTKIFVWRFCGNTIPVRSRLSAKGIHLPITCPMCNVDVDHLLHVFLDCTFAKQCWHYMGFDFDMSSVEYAPDWLLKNYHMSLARSLIKYVLLFGVYGYGVTRKCGRTFWECSFSHG